MFFKKKPKAIKTQDKVWISKTEKFRGLYNHLENALQAGDVLLIVNQFENTWQEIKMMLDKLNIGHQSIEMPSAGVESLNTYVATSEVMIDMSPDKALIQQLSNVSSLQILITEHHPIFSKEQELLGCLIEMLPHAQICIFTALDEPFMQLFGGDRIITLMENMGIKDNEPLEHSMITKSISRAQQKIEKKLGQNITASSQQEWMDRSGLL